MVVVSQLADVRITFTRVRSTVCPPGGAGMVSSQGICAAARILFSASRTFLLTSPPETRYAMLVPPAVAIWARLSRAGPTPSTYVLSAGEPARQSDVAFTASSRVGQQGPAPLSPQVTGASGTPS